MDDPPFRLLEITGGRAFRAPPGSNHKNTAQQMFGVVFRQLLCGFNQVLNLFDLDNCDEIVNDLCMCVAIFCCVGDGSLIESVQ